MMHRRAFLAGMASVFAVPLASRAQPAGKLYRVGFLAGGPTPPVEQFRRCLRDLGYIEGTNTIVERRWTEGRMERADQLAAELVRLAPDVLVALAEPPAIAMKKATREIPIVFVSLSNPIKAGLVSSLNQPGSNLTGLAWEVTPEITAKSVEILKG